MSKRCGVGCSGSWGTVSSTLMTWLGHQNTCLTRKISRFGPRDVRTLISPGVPGAEGSDGLCCWATAAKASYHALLTLPRPSAHDISVKANATNMFEGSGATPLTDCCSCLS